MSTTDKSNRVRHIKRGKTYRVIGEGEGQISKPRLRDAATGYVLAYPGCPDAWRVKPEDNSNVSVVREGDAVVFYQDEVSRKFWWRFPDEMVDGRFEPLAPAEGVVAKFVYSSVLTKFKEGDSGEVDHLEIWVHTTLKGHEQDALYAEAKALCARVNSPPADLAAIVAERDALKAWRAEASDTIVTLTMEREQHRTRAETAEKERDVLKDESLRATEMFEECARQAEADQDALRSSAEAAEAKAERLVKELDAIEKSHANQRRRWRDDDAFKTIDHIRAWLAGMKPEFCEPIADAQGRIVEAEARAETLAVALANASEETLRKAIDRVVATAEVEWSYREDDHRTPRDFWHARIEWAGGQSEWVRYGEQERRVLPPETKTLAEAELRNGLQSSLVGALIPAPSGEGGG